MPKINKLTTAQEARLSEFRDRFLAFGLSTAPADREAAESAVADAYRAGGLEPPSTIIWLPSPLAGAVGAAMLANDQVWAQVGAQVWAQVGAQVWAQVGAQVWAQVRAQVWDQVGDQVWAQVRAQVWKAGYGQHDAGWMSYYAYFAEVCGVADAARLAPLSRLSAAAGWWWPFENLCIITDRPSTLNRDAENRLHSETGPAIQYRDGWGVYAWHGTRIPSEWMTDRASLTPEKALTWANIEQRRAACEILGWEAILAALDAKSINRDDDPLIGELVEVTIPEIGRERFLRVQCGTGRRFALPVPPDMKTALEANAWTYGLDALSFTKPEVRT